MKQNKDLSYSFNYDGEYPCPVCHRGQLSTLTLMDALACNLCRHIFTANIEKQILKMADRQPPLTWRWNGKAWIGAHLEGVQLGWEYILAAVALVVLPTTLLGLAVYYFPPLPGSRLAWFPIAWTVLAFLSHLGIVLWLVIEFYQFPLRTYLRGHSVGRW